MTKLLYEKESYEIRGACFEVWNALGGGFKEKAVERALRKELRDRGLVVETQKRIPVMYKGEKVGEYVPDMIVSGKILIELKAKPKLTEQDVKQFWHYLQGSEFRLGFLVNFGTQKLDIRRKVYDTARE